jgi:hypothetical protein
MRDVVGFAKHGRGRKGGRVEGHGAVVRPLGELSIQAGADHLRWRKERP